MTDRRTFIKRMAGAGALIVEDQFSPTCREYVVAGNFLFHGREVLFV